MADEIKTKNKIEIRAEALSRLKTLIDSNIDEVQEALNFQLLSFLKNASGRWGTFCARLGEASTAEALKASQHLEWAYPKVQDENLEFYLNPTTWERGAFGIQEPVASPDQKIDISQLQGCLIPGLAFDRYGTRLGRGFGYFDRALENFKGLRVGVCFETVVFDEPLPRDTFDIPMDAIITEKGTLFFNVKGDRING